MTLDPHLHRLGGLAAGLCLDAGVRVEASEARWCYDPVRRVISVGKPDLLARGADYCAGVLAHEVGHFHVSRYHLFRAEFPSGVALSAVLNGIEPTRRAGTNSAPALTAGASTGSKTTR